VNDDALQAAWDAAVAACLTGHENCSYGGMSPGRGYWLADVDCPLDHHDRCVWCPAEPTTGFAGWAEGGWSIWGVPACEDHAAEWAASRPEWSRKAEPQPEPSWQELRAGLNPFTRSVAEECNRRMENALLHGEGPRPDVPAFTGLAGLADANGIVDLLAEHVAIRREQMRAFYAQKWDEGWSQETRRLWSGPDRMSHQVLHVFRVSAASIGLVPRSFLNAEYRRRQRARVKRRQR
jgi:hypothetical protein